MNSQERVTELSFTPIEQRYVATCYPLPHREGLDQCCSWKDSFLQAAIDKKNPYVVAIGQLIVPFPHLARLAISHYFDKDSVQEYFEGLSFKDAHNSENASHNPNLYLFAVSVARNLHKKSPVTKPILQEVMAHVEGCAVKPANIDTGELWTFSGKQNVSVDLCFFNENIPGPYVLVHGIEHGKHIAIRSVNQDTFLKFTNWFQDRWDSKQSPFIHSLD